MSQLTYNQGMIDGAPGDLAQGCGNDYDIKTYNNPDEAIQWGRGVNKIAGDDDGIKAPELSSEKFVGISVRSKTAQVGYWEEKSSVAVLKKGPIHVESE